MSAALAYFQRGLNLVNKMETNTGLIVSSGFSLNDAIDSAVCSIKY